MLESREVSSKLYQIVCDHCGLKTPEKMTAYSAQIEARLLGFHWGSLDGSFDYKDLCKKCYAKAISQQEK